MLQTGIPEGAALLPATREDQTQPSTLCMRHRCRRRARKRRQTLPAAARRTAQVRGLAGPARGVANTASQVWGLAGPGAMVSKKRAVAPLPPAHLHVDAPASCRGGGCAGLYSSLPSAAHLTLHLGCSHAPCRRAGWRQARGRRTCKRTPTCHGRSKGQCHRAAAARRPGSRRCQRRQCSRQCSCCSRWCIC